MKNKLNYNILLDTINDLKNNPNACTTYAGATASDGSFYIPESKPGEQLQKFIKFFYENELIDKEYVENSKKLQNKQLDEYTFEEVLTKITEIIRGDRFSSGYLYSNVKNGTMLKLIERLASFANNNNTKSQEDLTKINLDMARIMNYRMHSEQLFIPVLNDFKIENDNNPQTILLATGHGFTEQLTSDGYIEDGQFEQRIELVISNTKKFMKNSGCENVDNSFIFYKDYNNGVFNFKIYVCDMIIPIGNERKVIRQFNAYFVENKMHDFYQMSLSAGPFTMPTEQLKVGVIDLDTDMVTKSLDNLMKSLLDNLKYKNNNMV